MAFEDNSLDSLVEEYQSLCVQVSGVRSSVGKAELRWEWVQHQLVSEGSWTPVGAECIAHLDLFQSK